MGFLSCFARASAGALAVLLLAGCGGGGGGGSPALDPSGAQDLTDAQPPAETTADQGARSAGLVSRAGSLIYSNIFFETTDPGRPMSYFRANCFRTTCRFTEPQSGATRTLGLQDLRFVEASSTALLTKNGVTAVYASTADREGYLALMNHAGFGVTSARQTIEDTDFILRWGYAVGDLTLARPSVSATWRGLMVGTPTGSTLRENVLQGDATLTFTLDGAGGALDAAFTNIKDLRRNAAHSTATVRFDDVPVALDGTWAIGLIGNRIQGGFYGPGHAEAAGVFEQRGIVGAFGGKRQ